MNGIYSERYQVLKRLGFYWYEDYLRSDLWKRVREKAFAANGRACIRCGRKASSVHHAEYSEAALRGDDVSGLLPVCGRCHKLAHGVGEERERATLEEATAFLRTPWRAKCGPKAGTPASEKAREHHDERRRLWRIYKKMWVFRRRINPQCPRRVPDIKYMQIARKQAG